MRAHSDNGLPTEESKMFAPPISEVLTTEYVPRDVTERNPMIQPQMIQYAPQGLPSNPPLQGDQVDIHIEIEYEENDDDKPPEQAKEVYSEMNDINHRNNSVQPHQPEQQKIPDEGNRLEKRQSSKKLRKQRTFFFGVLSKRHGILVNLLRLLFAIVTLPFLLIVVIFTMVIITTKKLFCKIRKDEVSCCFICMCKKEAVDTCWDIVQCNCQSAALDCDKKYETLLQVRDKKIEGCIDCFTNAGEHCGGCFASICDKIVGLCEWIFSSCKKCLENKDKCLDGCCGCSCCDCSGCVDCAGECCGGIAEACCGCCGMTWKCLCDETVCEVLIALFECFNDVDICECLEICND